jgi:hypothetical protein
MHMLHHIRREPILLEIDSLYMLAVVPVVEVVPPLVAAVYKMEAVLQLRILMKE